MDFSLGSGFPDGPQQTNEWAPPQSRRTVTFSVDAVVDLNQTSMPNRMVGSVTIDIGDMVDNDYTWKTIHQPQSVSGRKKVDNGPRVIEFNDARRRMSRMTVEMEVRSTRVEQKPMTDIEDRSHSDAPSFPTDTPLGHLARVMADSAPVNIGLFVVAVSRTGELIPIARPGTFIKSCRSTSSKDTPLAGGAGAGAGAGFGFGGGGGDTARHGTSRKRESTVSLASESSSTITGEQGNRLINTEMRSLEAKKAWEMGECVPCNASGTGQPTSPIRFTCTWKHTPEGSIQRLSDDIFAFAMVSEPSTSSSYSTPTFSESIARVKDFITALGDEPQATVFFLSQWVRGRCSSADTEALKAQTAGEKVSFLAQYLPLEAIFGESRCCVPHKLRLFVDVRGEGCIKALDSVFKVTISF